jgi:hypothetical protein
MEVIVVDNNSTDGSTVELPKEFPAVKFIMLSENKGFGTANNIGAAAATGGLIFFINNDTLFTSNIIGTLAYHCIRDKKIGIVGPKLLNEDGSFQRSYGDFPTISAEREAKLASVDTMNHMNTDILSNVPLKQDWVTGAALMIYREILLKVGGFDENYFMYFEDIDLCKRVSNGGYSIQYVPSVSMIHLGGKSYGNHRDNISYEYRRSQLRYYDKYNSVMQRMLVRIFIFIKFIPKLFTIETHRLAFHVLQLVFSYQGKE